jgi:hypothetical protein
MRLIGMPRPQARLGHTNDDDSLVRPGRALQASLARILQQWAPRNRSEAMRLAAFFLAVFLLFVELVLCSLQLGLQSLSWLVSHPEVCTGQEDGAAWKPYAAAARGCFEICGLSALQWLSLHLPGWPPLTLVGRTAAFCVPSRLCSRNRLLLAESIV